MIEYSRARKNFLLYKEPSLPEDGDYYKNYVPRLLKDEKYKNFISFRYEDKNSDITLININTHFGFENIIEILSNSYGYNYFFSHGFFKGIMYDYNYQFLNPVVEELVKKNNGIMKIVFYILPSNHKIFKRYHYYEGKFPEKIEQRYGHKFFDIIIGGLNYYFKFRLYNCLVRTLRYGNIYLPIPSSKVNSFIYGFYNNSLANYGLPFGGCNIIISKGFISKILRDYLSMDAFLECFENTVNEYRNVIKIFNNEFGEDTGKDINTKNCEKQENVNQ